jgi:beta-galactosidase
MEFMFGEPSAIPGMNKEKREVHLPHEFMIESDVRGDSVNGPNTGFYDGGTATYTKFIDAPEQWSDKRF